ncbi:MAG: ABC transporter ATP-binding protein [Actinomycetota bacterium]
MNHALEWRGVSKSYGSGPAEVHALRGVSLGVRPGEFVAVMGPSGSGKSTLLHLAGGLERPTAGSVAVDGADLGALDARGLAVLRRRSIGYVFQKLNLIASLTAIENVMLPMELDGMRSRDARPRAEQALERAGLPAPYDRFPDDLSGGEQQRVAIARGIAGERSVLLADEPTGALDTLSGDRIIELLSGLAAAGTAVVLVTHEPRFASWADRVVLLRDGEIVDETTASLTLVDGASR